MLTILMEQVIISEWTFLEIVTEQPSYKWGILLSLGKSRKAKLRFGFSILDEHLSGSFDYFIEKRHDILTTRNTAPNFIAITMPVVNIGKVDNKGFELVLKWNHSIGDFKYWINGNLSYAKIKLSIRMRYHTSILGYMKQDNPLDNLSVLSLTVL